MRDLSRSVLEKLFEYDYRRGTLKWKVQRGSTYPGDHAGTIVKKKFESYRYKTVMVDGIFYQVTRICYILKNGEIPKGRKVRTRNGDGLDLSAENLYISNYDPDEL